MKTKYVKTSVHFLFLLSSVSLLAQNYSLTFGTDTATIRCQTPYTGVTQYCSQSVASIPQAGLLSSYVVRFISSNKYLEQPAQQRCYFQLKNPGDTTIGSGSEVQIAQESGSDMRLHVGDFTPSLFYTISFKLKINKQTMQHWSYPTLYFYFGNGKSRFLNKNTLVPFSQYPEDTSVFGLIRFRSDGWTPNYVNAVEMLQGLTNAYASVPVYPTQKYINQGATYTISIFANAGPDSVPYIGPTGFKKVPPYSYDVFVDSLQIRTSVKNVHYRGGPLDAFSWYVRDPNYFAPIIIDDVQWTQFVSTTPLPVKLTTFDASVCENTQSVCLSWVTELEIDNSHFVIERSKNGLEFDSVGIVTGFGTSTEQHRYVYEDTPPEDGIWYYRLRQVDFDGASAFSSLQSARLARFADDGFCYPQLIEILDGEWKLYDSVGREVATRHDGFSVTDLHGLYIAVKFQEGDDSVPVCRKKIWF